MLNMYLKCYIENSLLSVHVYVDLIFYFYENSNFLHIWNNSLFKFLIVFFLFAILFFLKYSSCHKIHFVFKIIHKHINILVVKALIWISNAISSMAESSN